MLLALYRYDPDTGALTHADGSKVAYSFGSRRGFASTWIADQWWGVSRIIWKMLHDEEPEVVAHIDGDRTNFRARNLQGRTRVEHGKITAALQEMGVLPPRFVSPTGTNGAGQTVVRGEDWGLYYRQKDRMWRVQFTRDGITYRVGSSRVKERARALRDAALADLSTVKHRRRNGKRIPCP